MESIKPLNRGNADITPAKYYGLFLIALIVPIILGAYVIGFFFSDGTSIDQVDKGVTGIRRELIHSLISSFFLVFIVLEVYKLDAKAIPIELVGVKHAFFYSGLALLLSFGAMYCIDKLGLESSEYFYQILNSNFEIVLGFFVICISAPIMEEILYRGILYRALVKSKLSSVSIILISSIVFTLVHTQYGLVDLAVVLILGIYLGWVRYKTNSLVVPIVCHAAINSTSYLMIIFSE